MRVPTGVLSLALIGGTLIGCVRPGAVAPATGERYLISAVELQRVSELSLYEAVRRLRPHFLRSRTATVEGKAMVVPVMLYVDGELMESLDELRRLPVGEVQEVRFYEPQLANTYFGRYNNAGGAIAVSLKWEPGPPTLR
jgi:hypothetical protein